MNMQSQKKTISIIWKFTALCNTNALSFKLSGSVVPFFWVRSFSWREQKWPLLKLPPRLGSCHFFHVTVFLLDLSLSMLYRADWMEILQWRILLFDCLLTICVYSNYLWRLTAPWVCISPGAWHVITFSGDFTLITRESVWGNDLKGQSRLARTLTLRLVYQ